MQWGKDLRRSLMFRLQTKLLLSPIWILLSIYLNKDNQKNYYNYIISQHPRRVIFNPGAENPEFEKILADKGIKVVEACTLVLLATGQY